MFFFVFLSLHLGNLIRFGSWEGELTVYLPNVVRLVALLAFLLPVSYFFELYEWRKFFFQKFVYYRVGAVFVSVFLSLSAFLFIVPSLELGRGLLLLVLVFFSLMQIVSRTLICRFAGAAKFATRTLIIGCGSLAQRIYDTVPDDHNIHSYVRFVACTESQPIVDDSLVVGHIDQIEEIVANYKPQRLITALSERRGNLPLREFMHTKLRGVDILEATSFYEQATGCLLVEHMQPSAFVYTDGFRMTPLMRSYKRLYDLLFSSIGLLLTLPWFPFLALAIKLDSSGPVFF